MVTHREVGYRDLLSLLRLHGPEAVDLPNGSHASAPRHDPDTGWQSVLELIPRGLSDQIAVSDGVNELSYGELDERVCRAAGVLHRAGLSSGDIAVLLVDRGIAFFVIMLAVWRLGAAYLPLATEHPRAWRARVIQDSGAALVVAEEAEDGVRTLRPQDLFDAGDREAAGPAPEVDLQPDDLAYVICTSGSTGTPKLVQIEHRGLSNLILALLDVFDTVTDRSRVLASFHPAFDTTVMPAILAWGSGGRLEVVSASQAAGDALSQVLVDRRISMAIVTPHVLQTLGPPDMFSDLDTVVCGGEVCPPDLAQKWCGHVRFVNGYGPAEMTVSTGFYTVTSSDTGPVPVGGPLRGLFVVVLDGNLDEVPNGEIGELCYGGKGVSRGYLGRPDLTAERFITWHGRRIYRTGDLGRLRADGNIEFAGRKDDQIKIAGARVEVAEVVAALRSLPGVRAAAVAVRGRESANRTLLGYVVPENGNRLDVAALRTLLAERYPSSMVPSRIIELDEIPLTVNDKLDESRLPGLTHAAIDPANLPRGGREQAVAHILAELLDVAEIGRTQELTELGVQSLLALQLIARMRAELNCDVSLSNLLTTPTIAGIARSLRLQSPTPQLVPGAPPAPSFAQSLALRINEQDPEGIAYNSQSAMRLSGPLRLDSWNAALTEIVARNDVLRTTFHASVDEAHAALQRCVVHPPERVLAPLLDLRGEPEHAHDELVAEAIESLTTKAFDLAHEYPVRWLLIRLSDVEHVFTQVEHHVAHDGWSFTLFVGDLLNLYAEHVDTGVVSKGDLATGYFDHAQWERDWCASPAAEAQREFWQRELEGSSPLLPLSRRAFPVARTFRGAAFRVEIDRQLARDLADLGKGNRSSLYMTLLTAYFILLHRVTGAADILVGSGVANRRHKDSERVLGMYVNMVVMRGRVDPSLAFTDVLAQVRDTALRVYDNQNLPFEIVFNESGVAAGSSVRPLVQATFSFHDTPIRLLRPNRIETTVIEGLSNRSARFDLSVVAVPRFRESGKVSRLPGGVIHIPASPDDGVTGRPAQELDGVTLAWEYDTALLDDHVARGLASSYIELLRSIVATPDRPISTLPIVDKDTEAELDELGRGPTVQVPTSWLPDLVERWVEATPDALAVCSDPPLTYRALWNRSDALAGELRAAGANRGHVVGVCCAHGAGVVVAQLGVLKSGAAFLPLDPTHPVDRQRHLLNEAQATLAVITEGLESVLPADVTTVVVDADQRSDLPPTPPPQGSGDTAAYVIYTSGSTGQPKGVVVGHRALAARLADRDYFGTKPDARVLSATSPTFDISIWELWAALSSGAAVEFLPRGWDLPALADAVARSTHCMMTPTVFRLLLDHRPDVLRRLTWLALGGEVVEAANVNQLTEGHPRPRLSNVYGPAEATIVVTAYPLDKRVDGPMVPIGRPLANSTIRIVDESLLPVPPGVVGEILAGGPGLADGYLNSPELTARKFVEPPGRPGTRFYRTGDRGRWLADGSLAFIGRVDSQVKIRGVRVELGEAAAALRSVPGVRKADAVSWSDQHGTARLIGYVQTSLDERQVRQALHQRVPSHLIPDQIVIVSEWPLTNSGKLDHTRLPDLMVRREPTRAEPVSELEQAVMQLALPLLSSTALGLDDNLFSLGLDSVGAMRLAAHLARKFGRVFTASEVFSNPTASLLAREIQRAPIDPAPSIPTVGRVDR